MFADRYRLEEKIGYGGAAIVWKAWDTIENRPVAVKIAKDNHLTAARFGREIAVLKVLDHSSILPFWGGSAGHKPPYLVSPHLTGGDLASRIRTGNLDAVSLRCWLSQSAQALQTAHQQGIWHRDIKPSNIMLSDRSTDAQAVVIDWGLGRDDEMTQITQFQRLVGTAEFFAPELLEGDRATGASDIWAWGVTAYLAASGRPPFQGETLPQILRLQDYRPPPLAKEWRWLDDILREIWNKEPADRPAAVEISEQCLSAQLPKKTRRLSLKQRILTNQETVEQTVQEKIAQD